ncbi:hypothetical protein FRB99_008968 [Tulasnella sp. 403]|nr:hypothetical protein FRB99_008968 [Tulasnella sp. 403]
MSVATPVSDKHPYPYLQPFRPASDHSFPTPPVVLSQPDHHPNTTVDDSSKLDLSQPVSVLLKESTKIAHEKAETSDGAKALLSGALPRDEYIRFLFALWHVYSALEAALDDCSEHPSIAPIYNPPILRRTEAISSDISWFLQTSSTPSDWQRHPAYRSFLPLPTAVRSYVSRIQTLAAQPDPTPLIAHAYVRYLGDLSGGQFIKRIIAKAYSTDGQGTNFYEFARPGSGVLDGRANSGDLLKLKAWFKQGMDDAVQIDHAKRAVVDEAILTFRLNEDILSILGREPTQTQTISSKSPWTLVSLVAFVTGSLLVLGVSYHIAEYFNTPM